MSAALCRFLEDRFFHVVPSPNDEVIAECFDFIRAVGF